MTNWGKINDPMRFPWARDVCEGDILSAEQGERIDVTRLADFGYVLRPRRAGGYRVCAA